MKGVPSMKLIQVYSVSQHASQTSSRNIIGRNPSMVILLLANHDLTHLLIRSML